MSSPTPSGPGASLQALLAGGPAPGATRHVDGPGPPLVFIPARREVWSGATRIAALQRSATGFRLLLIAATQGAGLDREALVEAIWEERYRGRSSDNRLRVALSRLRKEVPLALTRTPAGGLALSEPRAVWVLEPPQRFARRPESRLIGRDGDLIALGEALDAGPLVTLLGPGGVGKTTLARAARAARPDRYSREIGLWDLPDEEATWCALAAGLELRGAGDARARVLAEVAHRAPLLLLDNAETCPAAATVTPALLEAGARLLVTSRVPLGLPMERRLPLDSLDPDDAVRLYESRIARHGTRPDPSQRPTVRRLVEALDGLPLAVELAAARARVLPAGSLLMRIDRMLDLVGDDTTSLRLVLDQSWALLPDDARQLLARGALLPGGFPLEAAEAIAPSGGRWALDILQELHDHGLLREADGRFHELETVRMYAAQALPPSPEADAAVARWLLPIVARCVPALDGPGAAQALTTLAQEQPNLLALHQRCPEHRTALGAAWGPLALLRGTLPHALRRLQESIVAAPTGADVHRLQVARAQVLHFAGKRDAALQELEDVTAPEGARVRCMIEMSRGNLDAALQAIATFTPWDDLSRARMRAARGVVLVRKRDLGAAEADLREAVALYTRLGNVRGEGRCAANLADVFLAAGRWAEAQDIAEEARDAAERAEDRVAVAYALANVGLARLRQGEGGAAELHAAREHAVTIGHTHLVRGIDALLREPGAR